MIIALNHKSNLNKQQFEEYQKEFSKIDSKYKIIMATNHLNIGAFNLNNCDLAAQNVSIDDDGAHTGEISSSQLKSYNVKYCIVGHSERRQNQKETNEEINTKIKKLFQQEIIPILCVGETEEERKNNQTKEVIKNEIIQAINGLTESEVKKIIIAYEPIWSIGTGNIPTNNQINEIFLLIKEILPENDILYGGSANEQNINELKLCKNIDGYLLGGLSLKLDKLKIFLKNV